MKTLYHILDIIMIASAATFGSLLGALGFDFRLLYILGVSIICVVLKSVIRTKYLDL